MEIEIEDDRHMEMKNTAAVVAGLFKEEKKGEQQRSDILGDRKVDFHFKTF